MDANQPTTNTHRNTQKITIVYHSLVHFNRKKCFSLLMWFSFFCSSFIWSYFIDVIVIKKFNARTAECFVPIFFFLCFCIEFRWSPFLLRFLVAYIFAVDFKQAFSLQWIAPFSHSFTHSLTHSLTTPFSLPILNFIFRKYSLTVWLDSIRCLGVRACVRGFFSFSSLCRHREFSTQS